MLNDDNTRARMHRRGRIVVGGMLFYYPIAGVAWQQISLSDGPAAPRLGCNVSIETAESYPYLPSANSYSDDVERQC